MKKYFKDGYYDRHFKKSWTKLNTGDLIVLTSSVLLLLTLLLITKF